VLLAIHYGARERPKIEWTFLKTDNPLSLTNTRFADGTVRYYVNGVFVSGENVSGRALHQIDGEITLHRYSHKLPLFVMVGGPPVATDQIEGVPPRAFLSLGGLFRDDPAHWPEFGGFTQEISLDGERKSWSFSIDQLREAIDEFKRQDEEQWLTNVMNRPVVKTRSP
jgi:hypothetical protein